MFRALPPSATRDLVRFGSVRFGSIRFDSPINSVISSLTQHVEALHAVAQFGRILAIRIELPNWAPRFELPNAMLSSSGLDSQPVSEENRQFQARLPPRTVRARSAAFGPFRRTKLKALSLRP